jgi:hypothetical protein
MLIRCLTSTAAVSYIHTLLTQISDTFVAWSSRAGQTTWLPCACLFSRLRCSPSELGLGCQHWPPHVSLNRRQHGLYCTWPASLDHFGQDGLHGAAARVSSCSATCSITRPGSAASCMLCGCTTTAICTVPLFSHLPDRRVDPSRDAERYLECGHTYF